MKKLLIPLLLLPFMLFAQEESDFGDQAYIEVVGSAEKEIAPNIINLRIVLQETNEKNKIPINDQEARLKEKLKAKGFDLDKLLIRGADSKLQKIKRKVADVVNRKEYSIKLSSAEEAYHVLEICDELNASEASIFETSHTEIHAYRKEVKLAALQAAKVKAKDLLNSIGEEIGKPLVIREIQEGDRMSISTLYSNIAFSRADDRLVEGGDYLEIKPIRIRYEMFTRFGIK